MTDINFISYRKTQKGNWLIFEAVPYKQGIGVNPVGSPGEGYTTATQFDRADAETEAEEKAKTLAADLTDETCQWVVIPWQAPCSFNLRFVDLPKKYPSQKEYPTVEESVGYGWIHINPSKTLEHYRGRKIYCEDVTPGRSFGYNLAIRVKGDMGETNFAETSEIGTGAKESARFRTGDVVDAILAARKWIDHDLITQAEAAQIMADLTKGRSDNKPLVQTIRNAIADGRLDSYQNSSVTDQQVKQRHGLTLVSRAQVEQVWGDD